MIKNLFTDKFRTFVLFGCFIVVFIYLFLGNVPRFVSFPGLRDNILITEFLLYLTVFPVLFFNREIFSKIKPVFIIAALILISFLWGMINFGFQIVPFMYACRLIMMIFCSVAVGYALFKELSLKKIMDFFSLAFFLGFIIGIIFFITFPDSRDLWDWIANLGVTFVGDPHQSRFVSVFLDPNFYSVIIFMPILASAFLLTKRFNVKHLIFILCFLISVILTISRSGIGILFFMLIFLVLQNLKQIFGFIKNHKSSLWVIAGGVLVIVLLSVLLFPYVERIFHRVVTTSFADGSTRYRLFRFDISLSYIFDRPILGLGYNYYSTLYPMQLSSVDSSLLSMMLNFGIPITGGFIFSFVYWQLKVSDLLKRYCRDTAVLKFFGQFVFYIWVVFLFASQFNDVLFYQFWLIPALILGSYFYFYSVSLKEKSGADNTVSEK